jgi:hypothetical protein
VMTIRTTFAVGLCAWLLLATGIASTRRTKTTLRGLLIGGFSKYFWSK